MAKVEFRVDGVLIGKDTSYPYERVWDATGAAPGTHTIEARAYNRVGKTAIATVAVTVSPAAAAAMVSALSSTDGVVGSAAEEEEPGIWAPSTLSGSASSTRILVRQSVRLRARLTADDGVLPDASTVTVWRSVAGTWTYEGTASYDAVAGTYVLAVAPSSTAGYWFYFGGDGAHQAIGSNVTTIRTYPKVATPTVRSWSRFRAGGASSCPVAGTDRRLVS